MTKDKIPTHVAVIPDGNRRWAKQRGLPGTDGHAKAIEIKKVVALLDETQKIGIKFISLWGFSTENWKRSLIEKKLLFHIFEKLANDLEEYIEKNKVKFKHIGRKDRLPKSLIETLNKLEEKTKNNKGLNVQLCLDYGGRDEIVRAIKKMSKDVQKEIDESTLANYLDTANIPEPDLIVRTGGNQRLSGFMPYQGAYSELYFTKTFFPDFGPAELKEAVEEFSRRKRTFGGD